jgi:hypothetical protein
MKLSTFCQRDGYAVHLARQPVRIEADRHLASAVFYAERSRGVIARLRDLYGDAITIGGSGADLCLRLPPEADACFPDYGLYDHDRYALGFLTRGCH